MTWTVGQTVVIVGRTVPRSGFKRMKVEKVYTNGGCRTDDGRRWTVYGREHGDDSKWNIHDLRLAEDVEKWEAEELGKQKLGDACIAVMIAAKAVKDIDVLKQALAVLKGESQ